MRVSKIVNNRERQQVNGEWQDVKSFNPTTGKPTIAFNPKSIEISFVGHLTSNELADTNLFKNGGISAEDLTKFNASIAKAHPTYKGDNLQVVDGAFYEIVKKSVKGSTRPSRFRHATFKDDSKYTFVTVAIARESVDTSTVCEGI